MLIRFAVENFLSFREMTELSMIAGRVQKHSNHVIKCQNKRVLKGAYIFGANASGKSNLIRAVDFARNIVILGLNSTNCSKKYFRVDSSYQNKPGVFQFDLFSGHYFYSYGFAISYLDQAIEEEWLYRIDDNKEFCIFLRSRTSDGQFYVSSDLNFQDKVQKERFDVYKSDIIAPKMRNTLFLSDVAQRSPDNKPDFQAFRDVMKWFHKLVIIFPETKYGGFTELLDNDDQRTRLENLLSYFDTGIQSVFKKEVDFDKTFSYVPEKILDQVKANLNQRLTKSTRGALVQHEFSLVEVKQRDGKLLAYEVVSDHGNQNDLFDFNDESDGTRRLFDLIPVYQHVLKNYVVLIDELDRSLHTKAVQEFINYFYKLSTDISTQLIVTTHDSNIMDLDFLRQDEIWFIERQSDHSSTLYSLNKFKARFDKKVEKDYLLGRYGAIPIFRQICLDSECTEDVGENGTANQ